MGAAGAGEVDIGAALSACPGRLPADDAVATAEKLLWEHRRRSQFFPELAGRNPDWAILLDLFVQAETGKDLGICSACLASDAPKTTALRHIDRMVRRGDLVRTPSKHDKRSTSVRLSDKARLKMRALLLEFELASR
jgi:hypothetical protein